MLKRLKVALVVTFSLCVITICTSGVGAQDTITIGAVQTTHGPLAPFGLQVNDGLKDSIDVTNKAGGINGKKIVYEQAGGVFKPEPDKKVFLDLLSKIDPSAMYGNSTGLSKLLADDIRKKYKFLYSSTSFSGQLADPGMYPSVFVAGPTYGDQMGLLLMYIAKEKKDAKVAFFYSDTAFGKDPIRFAQIICRRLRLNLVAEVTAPMKDADLTKQIEELAKAKPDYIICHGFLVDPIPQLIAGCRAKGMTSQFMGTFWGATKMILDKLGPLADGYLAVNPYSYWWMENVPGIEKLKAYNAVNYPDTEFRPIYYLQGYVTGLIFADVLKRADSAGGIKYDNVVTALKATENLDTEGITAPLTIKNNRFPIARVWRANAFKGTFEPASDWLTLR